MTATPEKRKPEKKNPALVEANEALYDPYPNYQISEGAGMHIPWPEWSDADLNAETWGESKAKAGQYIEPDFYEDPNPPKCPPTVEELVYAWKRPQDVFPDAQLTVFDPTNDYFKLSLPSKLVVHEFFAHLIEALPMLQYYAKENKFVVEWQTPNYVPNTQGEVWRPWHHVYSLCKAGKGQTHKPLYSAYGKYVLRLFYMGGWRKFEVDDRIPCDKQGKCMLPTTQVPGELWPILLIKAMLKVVSLTQAKNFGMIDFPIITFFTGWLKETQKLNKKSVEERWRRFSALLPHYEVPEKEIETKEVIKSPISPKGKIPPGTSPKGKIKPGTSPGEMSPKGPPPKKEVSREFCFILGVFEGIHDESPHAFCLLMVRGIPLTKAIRREGTKAWKRIRWTQWASEKGLWTDEKLLPPYRRVQYLTFLKDIGKMFMPDPKHEAALFELFNEDESASTDQISSTGHSKLIEPKQWMDFNKFVQYLSSLVIYLKPSCFPVSLKVTSMKELHTETKKGELKKGTSTKASENGPTPMSRHTSHFESYKLKPSGNEPMILLCEGQTSIFLQFSLSVCPMSPRRITGYLDEYHPEVLTVGKATLTVEKYDWTKLTQGEIIGMGRTVGQSSFSLILRAGRHILKVWTNADSPFVVLIHSNGELLLGKGFLMRSLMGKEPVLILNYINKVAAAFVSLVQSFGKPQLSSALRDFYRAIEPGNRLLAGYTTKLDDFIETFLRCILLTAKTLISSTDELRIIQGALQSLFVNPKIVCGLPTGQPPLFIYSTAKKTARKPPPTTRMKPAGEVVLEDLTHQQIEKLVKIQKVFRGYRVRLLLKCQTPARVEFKHYVERLKKLIDLIFSPANREEKVGRLVRQVVVNNPGLKGTFRFHADFLNVCQVDVFSGKIPNVEPRAWIPITRFVIANHGNEPMPCAFYVSCNLEQYFALGVDNDTGEELFRLNSTVSPHYYKKNDHGYTIFLFGWNEMVQKTVNWRLEMMKMKHFPEPHICNRLIDTDCFSSTRIPFRMFEVRNFYVPNHRSRICRCNIRIQKRCHLTLRLSVSCPDARFFLTISLVNGPNPEDENIIIKNYSVRGTVLLPSVVLHYSDGSEDPAEGEEILYVLEALVIGDSWPLTKQEWGTVEPIRVNGENWGDSSGSLLSRRGVTEVRRRMSRTTKKYANEARPIENPYWLLQVLVDEKSDPTDYIIIEEDKSYAEGVRTMKISWEENDPGRRKRGRELRLNFLRDMYSGNLGALAGGEDDDADRESDEFSLMLNRLSFFSYLTSDDSPEKFIKSPRQFPKMPTQELLEMYKKQNHLFLPENNLENSWIGSLTITSMISWDRRSDYLNKYVRWRYILEAHFEKEQNISKQLMDQAYERRLRAIELLR